MVDKISIASWSGGRSTAKAMIWEWGGREFDDDRLFPKLQLTTVTLGWAGLAIKNLVEETGAVLVGRLVEQRQEPEFWHTFYHMG